MGARADEGTRGFGELLRLYRHRAGLSQEELAALSGLSSRAIAKMESGQSARPYRRSVLALADALQLPGHQRAELAQASRPVLAATDDEPVGGHAAPATLPEVRYSLPPDTPSFTGRQQELGLITAAAAGTAAVAGAGSCGVVAIGGMPGVGKTALAAHAAHLLAGRFPDRQLFLDLRGHTPGRDPVQAADALAGLLSAAGLDPRALPADLGGRAALWRDKMAGRRALLVLDNAASSAQVEPLLPGGECLVLVTSRRHLSDLPGAVLPVTLEVLQADEAVHMLTRMAPRTAADDPAEVADLARLAGFLPLAIALLARVHARHPTWRLADLIAETRQTLLTLSAEHASVAAAFEVSWARLDPAQRDFAALLGLHPGTSISVHAAAALAAVPVAGAAALLDGLHGEGLLAETGYRRYGMHDLIRQYAAGHAAADLPDQDRAAATARLLDYYQQAAAAAQALLASVAAPAPRQATGACALAVPDLASADDALGWVRAERAGLLASLDQATKTSQHARVVALTAGIAELLFRDGPWAEAIARHAAAVQAARKIGDRAGEAGALISLGEVRRRTADYPGAAADLTAGLAILRELGDRPAQARSLIVVAATHGGTGDYDAAAGALEESLAICRDLADQSGQARALASLGYLRVLAGDYRSATPALAEALAILRIFGDRAGQADTLRGLGQAREGAGDYPAAARDVTEALVIYRELGDRAGQASVLGLLGGLRSRTGDYPGAELVLQEALGIYRDLASRHGQANVLTGLGGTCRQAGQLAAADEYLGEALAIYQDIGDRGGEVSALNETAALRLACGDHAKADRCFEQALDLARQIGSSVDEADALAGLGRTARASGDVDRAIDSLQQALKIYSGAGAAAAAGILADLDGLADANIV